MRKGAAGTTATLAIGAGAFVVFLLLFLYHQDSSRSQSVQRITHLHPGDEILYTEPVSTNPTQAVAQMCHAIKLYNQSTDYNSGRENLAAINKGSFERDQLLKKVKVWRAPKGTRRPKLMCMTFGYNGRPGEAEWTQRLWAKKCDGRFLYTDATSVSGVDPATLVTVKPPGGYKDENGWQRLRAAVNHLAKEANQIQNFDYFLITNDQAFVVIENLRKMLAEPHLDWLSAMGTPVVVGHRMVTYSKVPFAGSAGFILNRFAMHVLSIAMNMDVCKPKLEGAALDLSLAECLREFNINFFDSVDEFGEDRIHIFHPDMLVTVLKNPSQTQWYVDYHHKPLPKGLDAMSEYTFLLGGFSPLQAHSLHELLYK